MTFQAQTLLLSGAAGAARFIDDVLQECSRAFRLAWPALAAKGATFTELPLPSIRVGRDNEKSEANPRP